MSYDAALHLLDRQVVDRDGRLVAKVDDVELLLGNDGALAVTALLCGLPALLPRVGIDVHGRPLVIELDVVDRVTSEVRLTRRDDGLDRLEAGRAADPRRWRLGALLGTPVRGEGIHRSAKVLDVRVAGRPGDRGPHAAAALVVGPGRPGALLGYDRRNEPGPLPVAVLVRWLHRHACVVETGPDVVVDRDAGEVRIGAHASVRPLLG